MIGEGSNVQDNCVIHCADDLPTIVGANVTVGHMAMLEGCVIGDGALVGMGAIVLQRATVGANALVAAGAVVGEGMRDPGRRARRGRPGQGQEGAGRQLAALGRDRRPRVPVQAPALHALMRTLGVDLASQDANTAVCLTHWVDGRCSVEALDVGVGNERILALAKGAAATGIDAPFGWPTTFVECVAAWSDGKPWPTPLLGDPARRSLRLRETDLWTHGQIGKWPLSVSSDSIAMCAMRAVTILSRMGEVDRVDGPYFEVYPGAALRRWNIDATGYKRDRSARERVVRRARTARRLARASGPSSGTSWRAPTTRSTR